MITVSNAATSMLLAYNGSKATKSMNTALERLITGFKINRPSDDVAGWYTFNKMSTDVMNYTSAQNNAQSGVNYLKTATGGMDEMSKLLKELDVLAKEAADPTISDDKRKELQKSADEKTAQITKLQKDTKFNGINVFGDDSGLIKDVPKLTEAEAVAQGYTVIKTAEEFIDKITANKDGKFILANDIDFKDLKNTTIAQFDGELNGNGFAIKNVTVDQTARSRGLFQYTEGATIKNLVAQDFTYSNESDFTGGLIGNANNTTIDNVAMSNLSIIDNDTCTVTGGIVGIGKNTIITNSWVSGDISSKKGYTGGFAGRLNGGSIENSYSTASIHSKADDGNATSSSTGGLVGFLDSSNISNSYVTGDVTGHTNVGGIVGETIHSRILNSYATGDATGKENIGGFIGYSSDTDILNSYATGGASGTDIVAGFIGRDNLRTRIANSYSSGSVSVEAGGQSGGFVSSFGYQSIISNSFWDKEKSGQEISYGGGTGLTTSQMNDPSNFKAAGWDTTNWDFAEGVAPKLQNMPKISNPKKEMNVFVGTKNDPSSNIKIDSGLSVKDLHVDLTSVEGALASLDNIKTVTDRVNSKKKEVELSSNRLTEIVDGLKFNIATLNDGIKKVYGANEDIENENFINAQILQEASQSLLMQSSQINSSIIMSLLPKGIGYR